MKSKNKFQTPYYAVIFTSTRTNIEEGYEETANRMVLLAKAQKGFLGVESARNPDGQGITISYWGSPEAIKSWKEHMEHEQARNFGRTKWYKRFKVRICKVEREYDFEV